MSGNPRLAVADNGRADFRAQSIGAYQSDALVAHTRIRPCLDDGRRLLKADDTLFAQEVDPGKLAATVVKHFINIAAMNHGIRITEAAAERLIDRNVDDLPAGQTVHHDEPIDENGVLPERSTFPQAI